MIALKRSVLVLRRWKMLSRRLYDERNILPDSEVAFFMGVPFHKELLKHNRIVFSAAGAWKTDPAWLSDLENMDKVYPIYNKAHKGEDKESDLEDLARLAPLERTLRRGRPTTEEWKEQVFRDYWLIVLQRNGYQDLGKGESDSKKFVRQGLANKSILRKEDAQRIIHYAYLSEHIRALRDLSSLDPLPVHNILFAVSTILGDKALAFRLYEDYTMNAKKGSLVTHPFYKLLDSVRAKRADTFSKAKAFIEKGENYEKDEQLLEGMKQLSVLLPMSPFLTCISRGRKVTFYKFGKTVEQLETIHSRKGNTHFFHSTDRGCARVSTLSDLLDGVPAFHSLEEATAEVLKTQDAPSEAKKTLTKLAKTFGTLYRKNT